MQQSEKAAAETEPQGHRTLRLKEEGRVIEAKLLQGVAEQRVLVRVHGVKAGEDHGLDVFKARQLGGRGPGFLGDGIADLGIPYVLDGGREKADFTSA